MCIIQVRFENDLLKEHCFVDANEGGMAEFMNAEMTNSIVASETGRSRKSQRTTRSSVSRPKTSTKATPRKPIRKSCFLNT